MIIDSITFLVRRIQVILSQKSQWIQRTDGPGFAGVFYDDERVAELEKKVSTLTQQMQEVQTRSEQQQAAITSLESARESLLQQVQELKDHIDELRRQLIY